MVLLLSSVGSGDAAPKWATHYLINHSWSLTNAFSGRALQPYKTPMRVTSFVSLPLLKSKTFSTQSTAQKTVLLTATCRLKIWEMSAC